MVHKVIQLAQFPKYTILVSLFTSIDNSVLEKVKEQLISGNQDYDFCFLNTQHIISLEHLYNAIHKALLNYEFGSMKAKSLNTEIIFSMSPINNIMDALKRFGVDETCPNVIAVKLVPSNDSDEKTLEEINNHLLSILSCENLQNPNLDDKVIINSLVDLKKFKKVYKLNDANLSKDESELQANLTRLAIGACQLRGC